MSEIFHKSCYTSRSSGYKYRTLSTNTGDRKRRDSKEDGTFDRKFKELRRAILSRVNREVNAAQRSRVAIQSKSEKVESKINSIIAFQTTVSDLRNNLRSAEFTLANLVERVYKLEIAQSGSDLYSMRSVKSPLRIQRPIAEEDDASSTVTHI